MIKSLEIKNFQSHKNSKLEFNPGVNIIIGKTDSGKTAIIRSLKWLFTNRPRGEAFRSYWGGDTEISIKLDSNIVQRKKTNKDNLYIVNETEEYKAIGTEVPEEVKKIFNINEINLQSQFDQPFLLNNSAGEVATHFNNIAHLHKIDTSLRSVNQKARALEQEKKAKKELYDTLLIELQQYENLDKLEIEVEVLEQMESEKLKLLKSISKIENSIEIITSVNKKINKLTKIIAIEAPIKRILALYDERDTLTTQEKDLRNLIRKNAEIKELITENNNLIQLKKPISELLALYETRETTIKRYNNIQKLINSINTISLTIKDNKIKIKKLQVTLKENMPEICPLCNQKIEKL